MKTIGFQNDLTKYIGLNISQAFKLASQQDYKARIVEENGKSYAVTTDFLPNRLNFVVENNLIVEVTLG
jgi:hypothetical protein